MADPVRRGGRVPREEQEEREERVRIAKEKEERRIEQLHADLRNLMPDPRFQRVMQDLMMKCGTFDSQEHLTAEAYRVAARRAVGMEVMADMRRADKVAFARMQTQMMLDILEAKEQSE